jgi:copper resistance protein C
MNRILGTIFAAALLASPASAHSMLKGSIPKDGASVAPAKQVTLEFSQKVHLTAVKLAFRGKDVPVKIAHGADAKRFVVPVKAEKPGSYQIRWSAMARDGHVMTGKLSFAVRQPQQRSAL